MTASARIGDAPNRVDGLVKVTGAARYAAEHPTPGLLHGWVVSSGIAKGRIAAVRDAATRAVPGVVEVITHANRPHVAWLDRSYEDEVSVPGSPFRALYDDRIAFAMQPVALVVAETLEAAREGAALLEIDYAAEPHNTDVRAAMAEAFEPKRTRGAFQMPKSRGDAAAALRAAPLRHTAEYRLPTHHHNPMEMHATTVVWEGDGRITVHDKTQGAQNVQAYLAGVFGFSKKKVRVLNPYVGGAFGSGLRPQYQVYLATLAAKMLERSVRVVLTRQQMFTHVHRPEAIQTVSIGTGTDGRLQAIVNDATTVTSRYENYMEAVCNWGLMAYACPDASATYTLAPIDTSTPGDMRAPGAATGMTLFEIAMDEAAVAAGVDPLAFRLLNYTDVEAMTGRPFTSKALREAYAQGAERFGWGARTAEPGSMRDGSERIGWGVATGMWDAMFMATSARVRLHADGRLDVECATADIGTGTHTVMAQVASEALGVPFDRVTARLGDSDLPDAPVEGGSWGAASTGAAVQLAGQSLARQLYRIAASMEGKPLGGAPFADVRLADGRLEVAGEPTRSVALDAIVRSTRKPFLEAEETASPGLLGMADQLLNARNTHSAVFAEVKVDAELGVVRVTRIVVAVAAGRIVNPKTARSQILGGVVMGMGMALHEESLLDHRLGRFVNHNFAEYHVPVHADVESIEVIFVDEPDPTVTPLGVKGLGEIGIVGTAAAIVNAIHHATGRRVRSLPATIDKLL
jgi:xanthine dehydrogenase YagR molybdenum-binding subunit